MSNKLLPLTIALISIGIVACAPSEDQESSHDPISLTTNDFSTSAHPMINGIKDTSKEHNAVVSIFLKNAPGYDNQSICTGTLIHPSWVLTAAHCVAEEKNGGTVASALNPYLKIGVGNTMSELENNLYSIDQIYYHTYYGTKYANGMSATSNDIAMIHLSSPIPENKVLPIEPLTPNHAITRAQIKNDGVDVLFVGFGKDENNNSGVKLKYSSKLVSYCGGAQNDNTNGCYYGTVKVNGCHPDKSKCSGLNAYSVYCQTGYFCLKNIDFPVYLPYGTLYYEHDPGGTCNGDSGGPAFVTIDGTEYVAGLTSFGDSACAKVGVHTAVQDFYNSFILQAAPEVAKYHEARNNAWQKEIKSGICGSEHIKSCKEKYNQDTCYFTNTYGDYTCTDLCYAKGAIQSFCRKDSDGKSRVYKNVCRWEGNDYKFIRDDSLTETCSNGCNNNGTACYVDSAQQEWNNEISSGICGKQHIKKCVETYNRDINNTVCYFTNNSNYMCTDPCTKEGSSYSYCLEKNGKTYTETWVCKNVHGTLMSVRDDSLTEDCANGCNSSKTACLSAQQQAWNNEIATGICGPEHVKKCIQDHGEQFNACYFLNAKGNYQCSATCTEEYLNKLVFMSCSRLSETEDYKTYLTFCIDKGAGPILYIDPEKAIPCEHGCHSSGLFCETPEETQSFVETFDGIAKSTKYDASVFESPNTSVTWNYEGRTSLDAYEIDGSGIILKSGYITGFVHSGITNISVDLKKAFTSKKERSASILLNDVPCNTISIEESDVVKKLECANVEYEGDVKITIQTSGDQITVDNISWTTK